MQPKLKIHQLSTAFNVACLGLAIALVIPALSKAPPITLTEKKVSPTTPDKLSELRELKLTSGEEIAIVKLWGYTYTGLTPNTDLKVIREAQKSGKYLFLILESDEPQPVWGWYLRGNQVSPINQQFTQRYPEIFK